MRWRHRVAQFGAYCFDAGEWLMNLAYGPDRITPEAAESRRIIDDPSEPPTSFADDIVRNAYGAGPRERRYCIPPVKIGVTAEAMRAEAADAIAPAREEPRPPPLAGSLAERVARERER